MRTINNYLFVVLACVLSMFTACSDDIVREPSPVPTDGIQAYIYADATSITFTASQEQTFVLNVARQKTDEAATVHLNAVGEGFSVPATVDFAAGEGLKQVNVTFDIAIGTTQTVTISIPEEEAYVYGSPELTFNITRDYTWLNLGIGAISSSFYGGAGNMQVFVASEIPTLYKAIEPYEEGYDLLFTINEDNTVIVEKQAVASSYGDYGTLSVEGTGVLEDGIITLSLTFSVPEGTFGAFTETIQIPEI